MGRLSWGETAGIFKTSWQPEDNSGLAVPQGLPEILEIHVTHLGD
jgi:hypothetical protein